MSNKKHKNDLKTRPSIGLLLQDLQFPLHFGAVEGAHEYDANLFCFMGDMAKSADPTLKQANIAFSLANPKQLDALALWGASGAGMGINLNQAEMKEFIQQYAPRPVVSYERKIEGVPVILTDVYQGVREAIRHLIEIHHCQRIALIWGPAGHFETEERVRAYRDTLAEYNLPVDPTLISDPVQWGSEGGVLAINALLQGKTANLDRGLIPGVDFDAIFTTDGRQAVAVVNELNRQGIQVPDDVAIIGFDERDESRLTSPPLTTINKPFKEIGKQLIKLAIDAANGQELPGETHNLTQIIIRQSCGCVDPAILQASLDKTEASQEKFDIIINTRRANFIDEIIYGMQAAVPTSDPGRIRIMVDRFVKELEGDSAGGFTRALNDFLYHEMSDLTDPVHGSTPFGEGEERHQRPVSGAETFDGSTWQNMISAMQWRMLPYLDGKKRVQAEALWNQARIAIGASAQRLQAYQAFLADQKAQILREIEANLSIAFDLEVLSTVLATGLPRLGIPSCYLSLYDNPSNYSYKYPQPAPEWSRLVMAYTENGRILLPEEGVRFNTQLLAPHGLLPQDRQASYFVFPLYFGEEQQGFLLLEIGPQEGAIYNALKSQIASALHGASLVKRIEERAVRLQAAAEVSRAASSIQNPDELIHQAVELICDRFNLYYVGLFLLEEDGQSALLHAGTGEPGKEMISQGHHLEVGGNSMIGWCIANQKARIALDVGHDPVRFENPLLPNTRSELALPLLAHGMAIGAITIQSEHEAAFNEGDITILQSMADQLANAIETTRLMLARQQAEIEIERRAVQLQTTSEISKAASSLLDVNELTQQAVNLIRDRFGLYYAGLFLIDQSGEWTGETGRWVVLRAGTGEAGQKMLDQGHKLEIGGASMIGWCTANKSARITLDTGAEADQNIQRFKNPLLPETQSEMALPLISRGQVLGALSIQSSQRNAFNNEDVTILQSMADQLANAISNASLYAQTQSALKEMEAIYRRYLVRGWSEYGQTRSASGYLRSEKGVIPLGQELLPEVQQALLDPYPTTMQTAEETQSTLVVPIKLRDYPIGAIGLKAKEEQRQWSEDEISLVEILSEQFALAAENLRLLEETQRRAEREHLVSEITTKMRTSNDPQAILQTAASELRRALNAKNARVMIESLEQLTARRAAEQKAAEDQGEK